MISHLPSAIERRFEPLLYVLLALLGLAITGWIYIPGAAGPALLDDYSNVAVIPDLGKSPELALDYVLGNGSGLLGRPVPMASFVLESLLLERSVEISKLINIGLHLFNGCLVIWLFRLLFRHLQAPGATLLAILLGAAWLLTPLYVSTVLYVVQRMAMLAATFMLLAMISYIYWRNAIFRGKSRPGWLFLVLLFFVLALLSKENAIVLVPMVLLLETLWFEFKIAGGQVSAGSRRVVLTGIALGTLVVSIVLIFGYDWFAGQYHHRHFTLPERLLTQARVLWDYMAQHYLPNVSRMGIYHDDVIISKSLSEPLSTLYSVIGWGLVVLGCAILLRWSYGRYFVFAIAFFLVGHGIESSVFALELYFEHRNYFPGIGLFLALGVVVAGLVKKWPQVRSPLLAYLGVYVLLLSSQTSSQVQIWSNEALLTLNNLNAHPESFRANADMASYMVKLGDIDAARYYSARSYAVSRIERPGDHLVRNLVLSCAVNEPVDSEQFEPLGAENPERPFNSAQTLLVLVKMLQDDICPAFDRVSFADRMVAIFLEADAPVQGSSSIYFSLAVLENALERYEYAYAYADKLLSVSPNNKRGLLMKLHFASALGMLDQVSEVIETLLKLDEQGNLTVGEKQTLALYLEG
jgi:hypothetical protein